MRIGDAARNAIEHGDASIRGEGEGPADTAAPTQGAVGTSFRINHCGQKGSGSQPPPTD